MAVIVKYVVVRNGKENMTFATKKEADAYDKMLDIAERLYAFLQTAEVGIDEDTLDALTFFMAQHRDPIGKLLKGGKIETATTGAAPSQTPPAKEEKGREAAKRTRATKPKAVA